MSCEYVVKMVGKESSEEMINLFNQVFNRDFNLAMWIKKHYENPNGDTIFWGAFCKDKLVAINGFMPMVYISNEVKFNVLQSCESAVDINHRHKGLFSKLILAAEKWAEDNDIDFFIGMPNMFSYPGFKKLGWSVGGTSVSYGAILSLTGWIKEKKPFRPLADTILLFRYLCNLFVKTPTNMEVDIVDKDRFLEIYEKRKSIVCDYTKEFLDWKLNNNAKIYLVSKKREPLLIVVVRSGVVIYYQLMNDDEKLLKKAWVKLRKVCGSEKGMMLVYSESATSISPLLQKAGFVNRREPDFYRIVKMISEKSMSLVDNKFVFFELERD